MPFSFVLTCYLAEIQPLYTGTELNLRDRVLGEVENNSFIALPGKGDHSRLMLPKLCVPNWGVWVVRGFIAVVQRRGHDQFMDILLIGWW